MSLIHSIVSWVMKQRVHQIELFLKYPHEVQLDWFKKLIQSARDTEFGKQHGFKDISNYRQFAEQVPVRDYEALKPYIERMMMGFLLYTSDPADQKKVVYIGGCPTH